MFEYIKGTVDFVGPEYIVVENHGLGFQILAPNPFIYSSQLNQQVKIFIYQYVREDIISLYGFSTMEEKNLYTKLLNVSGIGPKGALAILASGEVGQVVQAIEQEDEGYLMKFPGVGKKTARQMILDLKGKLQNIVPDYFPDLFNANEFIVPASSSSDAFEEAILALKALGYTDREIKKVSPELRKEQLSSDQYIKKALQRLLK